MNSKTENKFMPNFQRINKQEYKDLLGKASFSTFFHGVEWHEFLEKEFKWLKFEYYSYKKEEAVLPLARFKVLGKEKLVSLPFEEYGGPLTLKGDINWEEFTRDAFKEFGDSIKIKFHPEISGTSGHSGTSSISSSYWLKNLENITEQELLSSFRKTLRHEIEHAQEQNLQVKKHENPGELKQFYNLYVANLRRKKTIPYPWPLVQFLCKNPSNELLLALYKGKVMAGCLFLNYSVFVHYFLSASDYEHRNLGANYLILWKKIKSLIGQSKIFDLGASPQGSSLEIFKRGWGGEERPIFILENKKNSEGLRSSKLRNVFGLLPNFAVKKLSRYLIKYRI